MTTGQNLAVKLCGLLQAESTHDISAREWRLLGQEQDGSQIFSWLSTQEKKEYFNIGIYANKTKTLKTLHKFSEHINIIQASVNASHSAIVYVVKSNYVISDEGESSEQCYYPFLLLLQSSKQDGPVKIQDGSIKQMMVQYLYGKSLTYSPSVHNDRFILFMHLDCIKLYKSTLVSQELDDEPQKWDLDQDSELPPPDVIVKVFSWAQWDCINQVLYYIHYRQPTASFAEGEEVKSPTEVTPTLSALQFHVDLPHETVLNIPLSLPQLGAAGSGAACGQYEDAPVPLRVRDCSLDLQIVSDPSGIVCICHHYLYKSLDDSTSSLVLEDSVELKESGVNFAYSITLLHHGLVVHSVVPDLPWKLAKSLRPSYALYGSENHLLVNIPMLFTHLLDTGLSHEPCCHTVLPSERFESGPSLAPLIGWSANTMVDLNTLDLVELKVEEKDLVATFKSNTVLENKLAILHYVIQHEGNCDVADELVSWMCVNQHDGFGSFQRVMQEYLIGSTYAATRRSLPTSAAPLTKLLPFTQHSKFVDVKVGEICVSVSQERLWNTSVVLLAPRQRLAQFTEDLWTRLWEQLAPAPTPPPARFRCAQVLDKLRVSLDCYQPEALSRCTTPMSPSAPTPMLPGAPPRRSSLGAHVDFLPFFEVDVCTASKQEHIIAATPPFIPGVVGAQCGSPHIYKHVTLQQHVLHTMQSPHSRDDMDDQHAAIVFKAFEQYYLAADSIAFPLPQGFTSFFTYLGFRTLPFYCFLQYVHRNVFELQIDVVKAIIVAKEDNSKRSVNNKLRLIQLIGDGRARRALAAWPHPAALVLRARDHAATLLSGQARAPPADAGAACRTHHGSQKKGIAAFPSGERLSPLDTFLDLLTAKASLNELDFNLIIEATLAAVHSE